MNELVQVLRKQEITCKFYGIGSYAKNMVTKNGKAPYDLDYNIEITKQKSWLAETLISFFCTKFSEKP